MAVAAVGPLRASLGGTVIALSVEECNGVQIAALMRLAGDGLPALGARLRPSLAVGVTAFLE